MASATSRGGARPSTQRQQAQPRIGVNQETKQQPACDRPADCKRKDQKSAQAGRMIRVLSAVVGLDVSLWNLTVNFAGSLILVEVVADIEIAVAQ